MGTFPNPSSAGDWIVFGLLAIGGFGGMAMMFFAHGVAGTTPEYRKLAELMFNGAVIAVFGVGFVFPALVRMARVLIGEVTP